MVVRFGNSCVFKILIVADQFHQNNLNKKANTSAGQSLIFEIRDPCIIFKTDLSEANEC